MHKSNRRYTVEFIRVLVFILLVFTMLFSVAVMGRRNKLLKDKIHSMEREQQRLVEENKLLVTDISLLANNDRIEVIASQELNMHRASTAEIRRVEIPGGH